MPDKPCEPKIPIRVGSYRYHPGLRHSIVALAVLLFSFIGSCRGPQQEGSPEAKEWLGTWSTSQQLVEPRNMPPEPGLSNNTLRQVVRASLGGERLRARFSNEFSTSPVTLKAVHIAVSAGGSAIDLDVVVLGNSITDGRGSGTNKQNRWPDALARRLQDNPGTEEIAVLNAGIGGNCVLRDCLGPAARTRLDRDVLEQNGVGWLIILEGINDIGQARGAEAAAAVADDLVIAYEQMINKAHAKGIRVYGAPLLPFGGSFYDSAERETARKKVNEWIRNSGRFDGIIDLEAALCDPADPLRLLPVADTGDHLHPNETGHRLMAEAVDLALFAGGNKRP